MKIELNAVNKIYNTKRKTIAQKTNLPQLANDVFVKSAVSFGGNITNENNKNTNQDYENTSNGNKFDIEKIVVITEDKIDNEKLFDEISDEETQHFINRIAQLTAIMIEEKQLEQFLKTLSDKKIRNLLFRNTKISVEQIVNCIYKGSDEGKFISEMLRIADVKTGIQFQSLLNNYGQKNVQETFKDQNIEYLDLYSVLENREDIAKFPDIELYIHQQETAKDDPDYGLLVSYPKFLKQIGINNSSEIDTKLSHLKSKFNNFESLSDKFDAIDYERKTYENKIELLNETISKQKGDKIISSSEKIYPAIIDFIDYYYEKNSGKSIDGLDKILDTITNNKINNNAQKQAENIFNDFKELKNKADFYEFLADNGISTKQFNSLMAKTAVTEFSAEEALLNFAALSDFISEYKNIDTETAKDIYTKQRDIINTIYDSNEQNFEYVEKLLNAGSKYHIKTSEDFLNLYNKVCNTKLKSIDSEKIKYFLTLTDIDTSKDILKDAKNNNVSALELLEKEKEKFDTVKTDIENYLKTANNNYFIDKNPLQIYKEYKSLFENKESSVADILQNISDFGIVTSSEYANKSGIINQFENKFSTREQLLNFFSNNEIKFDESDESISYRNNCLNVLSMFDNCENADELKEKISTSNFLITSKKQLPQYIENIESGIYPDNTFEVLVKKQVPSLPEFNKFLKKYSREQAEDKNIIKFLEKLPPETDYKDCKNLLEIKQQNTDKLNVPITINAENILNPDINDYIEDLTSLNKTVVFISKLLNTDENFISKLPDSKLQSHQDVKKYRIADEITKNSYFDENSYKNIISKLKIDKKINTLPVHIYRSELANLLNNDFVKFVNSNDWLNYNNNENEIPNVSLHAKLRAIERFALEGKSDINDLYSDETKNELKDLFKTIYTEKPINTEVVQEAKRLVFTHSYKGKEIISVFANSGELITLHYKD